MQGAPLNAVPSAASSSPVALQVYQRQLSKEGLQNVVNKSSGGESGAAGTAAMSAEELRDLFTLRRDTLSDTYDSMCQAKDEAICLDSDKASHGNLHHKGACTLLASSAVADGARPGT